MAYVSSLLGRPVADVEGERVGYLEDLIARIPERGHPQITAIVLRSHRASVPIAIAETVVLIAPAIPLRKRLPEVVPYQPGDNELYLARDVLDKQIIDTDGIRVVRVNDLELLPAEGHYYVANVDIGSLGLLRRLGLAKPVERLARLLGRSLRPTTISWENVELLPGGQPMRLRVPSSRIAELHPADLAEILSDLSRSESSALLDALDVKVVADTLEEVEPEFQVSLVQALPNEKVADVLEEMAPDEAADLLAELPPDRSQELLSLMEDEEAADVRKLLGYPEDTAGGLMTTEFATVRADLTAEAALRYLRETVTDPETLLYVYVLDEQERLVGVFSLGELVLAPPDASVRDIMEQRVVSVRPEASQDEVAQVVAKYNLLAVPVVDGAGHLHGIVTADDALDKVIPTSWKKRMPRWYHESERTSTPGDGPQRPLRHLGRTFVTVRHRLRPIYARLLLLLSVVGPGIITANVDNDAGGITTYSVAGAHYGYRLLWLIPFVALALIVVQEMSARLGVVTGKGLGALIREVWGVRATAAILGLLVVTNLANTVSEFAGIAASLEIFGVSKYLSVPVAALCVWLLVLRADYRTVERVFLVASGIYLCYVASGFMARPPWPEITRALVRPQLDFEPGMLTMAITVVGTTIAPWMQFYQQSSIVDKGLKPSDYAYERLDVIVGSLFAVFVAAFITISCAATLHVHGVRVETAKEAALGLGPLAGRHATTLFALGLLNASLFSAAILPLSTAYVVCEAFGWESGLDRSWREAPLFFSFYTALIVLGAAIILLPIPSLVQAMMASQTLNGILLPVILIVMLRLINSERLMGRFRNSPVLNALSWGVVTALIVLTGVLVAASFWSHVGGP